MKFSINTQTLLFLLMVIGTFYLGNTVHGEAITLQDNSNSEVTFPSYLPSISGTIHNILEDVNEIEGTPIPTPASSNTLVTLKKYVKYLPCAARDIDGQFVAAENINKSTLFVNGLVKENVQAEVYKETPTTICDLYILSNHLDIQPLLNAFASIIADTIYSVVLKQEIEIPKKEEYKYISKEYLRILSIREALKDKGYIKCLPDELILSISKYVEIKKLKVKELTIEDYIGTNGQPQMEETRKYNIVGKKIDLSNKQLTSLQGLHLLRESDHVLELDLSGNYILGNDIDSDFPIAPFRTFSQLRNLSLASSGITSLSVHTFRETTHLQWLSLKGNRIQEIDKQLKGLSQLKWLYLNENQLMSLSSTAFETSKELKLLYLDNNQLDSLPNDLFIGLDNLRFVSVHQNKLQGTKTDFEQVYFQGKNPSLYFNDTDLLEKKWRKTK